MTIQILSKEVVPGDILFVMDLWAYEVNKVYTTFNNKSIKERNPIVIVELKDPSRKKNRVSFYPNQRVFISKRKS